MESDHNSEMGGSGGAQGSSRWNPTKEQINMLEGFYAQGIRTPSAEQIQQITSRLKVYGHIEGKNVFYWFQNHKARQRQKQKQESLASINRYLHTAQPIFPVPSTPNVICGPYYLPQSDNLGFYPTYPKVLIPAGGFKRRPRIEKSETTKSTSYIGQRYGAASYEHNSSMMQTSRIVYEETNSVDNDQETLPLFPLQPTDLGTTRMSSLADSASAKNSTTCSDENVNEEGSNDDQPYFDFFSRQASFDSH